MSLEIDYYFATPSPYAYLGHSRFAQIAAASGAKVNLLPMDLGKVFPASGGLPLGQRVPQRQAYRLLELKRFSEYLQMPMHIKPQFFPVAGDAAARLILATQASAQHGGQAAAMQLCGAVFAAVWAQQRNIADLAVLAELLAECGLPAEILAQSQAPEVQAQYEACTQRAIDAGVFGAPSFVVNGEMFWGQDRLDFVERKCRALA
jgi:2-hydroxychromene-2-carboxylate isomerase